MINGVYYWFTVLDYRVVDGDTLDLTLDLGMDISIRERVRLWGIDAAEIRTKDLEEKERGLAAKIYLETALADAKEKGYAISFHSKVYARGKYGRLLGDIYAHGENLNVTMLNEGIVEPYTK